MTFSAPIFSQYSNFWKAPTVIPTFGGRSQICIQSAPPVKATNGEKLKMLNCKFACISDPAANTMRTAVTEQNFNLQISTHHAEIAGKTMFTN